MHNVWMKVEQDINKIVNMCHFLNTCLYNQLSGAMFKNSTNEINCDVVLLGSPAQYSLGHSHRTFHLIHHRPKSLNPIGQSKDPGINIRVT